MGMIYQVHSLYRNHGRDVFRELNLIPGKWNNI